jgi:hypothetical protein
MHAAREEAQASQSAAAGFEMRPACGLVATLGVLQVSGDAAQVDGAVFDIKRQRAHQRVGGGADLGQRDLRIFPPEAAGSGGPRKDD